MSELAVVAAVMAGAAAWLALVVRAELRQRGLDAVDLAGEVAEYRVRRLPRWLRGVGGTTLGTAGTVWVRAGLEGHALRVVVEHERAHLGQARRGGWPWRLAYLLVREVRRESEAQAYAVSVALGVDLESAARSLSGPLYLWCCSTREARDAIAWHLRLREGAP